MIYANRHYNYQIQIERGTLEGGREGERETRKSISNRRKTHKETIRSHFGWGEAKVKRGRKA